MLYARGTAFASDFDGTLCESNWETGVDCFGAAVVDAVHCYQEQGGLFGICSGRPLSSIIRGLDNIIIPDFYIVASGAQVLDRGKSTVFERTIDKELIRDLFENYKSKHASFLVGTENDYIGLASCFALQTRFVSSVDNINDKIYCFTIDFHGDENCAMRTLNDIRSHFATYVECYQNRGSIDIVSSGCSKGSGIQVLRQHLEVEHFIGAGDSYNDLPLLNACDISYTFQSSPKAVRELATFVVDDLSEALYQICNKT